MALKDKLVSLEDLKVVGDECSSLKSALSVVEDHIQRKTIIDLTDVTPILGFIKSDGTWNTAASTRSWMITVPTGAYSMTVTASSTKAATVALLQNDNVTSDQQPNYCTGTGRTTILAGESQTFILPNDCAIVYVNKVNASGTDLTPESIWFIGWKEIPAVDDTLTVEGDAADAKATGDRLAVFENAVNPVFVLPDRFEMVGGIQYNFYYQNMILGYNTKLVWRCSSSRFTNFDDFARYSPANNTSSSNQGGKFYVSPFWGKNIDSPVMNFDVVPSTAGGGLTKKVLLIGDSLTANSPLSQHLVDNLLTNDDMTVTLIGTRGTAPYLREGRSGWSPTDYVHKASVDDVTNAFYNPTSQTFDFSYYMTQNGFDGVDYVFINLGTNISSEGYTVTIPDMIADLETMVTSIHAYNSNIRVGVWMPPPRALIGNGDLENNYNTLNRTKAIVEAFSGKRSERTYIVPAGLNVDPYHDFPTATVNVSARNSDFQMTYATDKTHPSNAGYAKMADVIYGYIKYFGSLDAT